MSSPPSPPRAVLVVDDSSTIRRQVQAALTEHGFAILEAADGVEALERVRAADRVDAVVCDINMPRMNGLDLLLELGQLAADVPVIMLTTEGQPELVRQARERGAKGWIVKPFKPELLVQALDRLTRAA